jgi:hypothetical protein
MSLPAAKRIRVEDYLAFERASETKHEYMDGIVYPWGDPDHPLDPDVVQRVDRVGKLRRYAHASSLREYVLINSIFPEVEVRRLEHGQWINFTYEPDEIVHLESIKLYLDFATIYRNVQWATE